MSFIYNLILCLILFSSIYEVYGNEEQANKQWYYTIVVLMILVAGLGYGLSPDWVAYWNAFEGSSVLSFGELEGLSERLDMEAGFLYLNKIISSLGLGFASFTFIFASIAIYLKASTIYKYSGIAFLGLLMYMVALYFFEDQVQIRQGMANAITVYSIRYVIDRKLYKFLICIAIAFLMHKTSIVFIFAYWIVLFKFNRTWVIVVVGLAVLVNYSGLSLLFDSVFQLLPFGVGEKYDAYNEAAAGVGSSFLGDVVKILTVIAIVLFDKQASEKDPYYAYFRTLYLFGVALYFFFGGGIFAVRLPNYYLVFLIFMIPRMVMAFKDIPSVKNIIYISFAAYSIALYIHAYNNNKDKTGFSNYTTVFNKWVPYSFFQD